MLRPWNWRRGCISARHLTGLLDIHATSVNLSYTFGFLLLALRGVTTFGSSVLNDLRLDNSR